MSMNWYVIHSLFHFLLFDVEKKYHITFTVTLNHKTKQIETSIELIGTILTRIVTYTKFFTRYTKVFFLTNQRVRYKQN